MKTIIIVINILLLSLILYNLLSNGDKLIENMAGCPDYKELLEQIKDY